MSNREPYPDEIPTALLLDSKRDDWGHHSRYLTLTAQPIRIDDETGGPRNISDGPHCDLSIHAQADPETPAYGFTTDYRQRYAVGLADLPGMLALLRKIERHTTKTSARLGYPQTFGEYVVRVADALGITQYMIRASAQRSSTYADDPWTTFDAATARYHLDRLDREYRAEYAKAPA